MKEPLRPEGISWVRNQDCNGAEVYDQLDGIRLLSQVHDVPGSGEEYHVSVSKAGRRIPLAEARQLLSHLNGDVLPAQWDEDNHVPGIARHFWAHTIPTKRKECDCKGVEKPHVEGDYTWREERT